MDYKKEYEQAIERAKGIYNETIVPTPTAKGTCEYIFPELKESEDESIRKELIQYLKDYPNLPNGNYSRSDFSAWLEKQDEKVDAIENFNTEFERQISHLIASTINKEHEYNEGFVKWTANALLNYAKHELEKQREHKCDCKYVGCHVNNVKRWCHKKQSEILYEKCNIKCSEYLKQGEQKPNDKIQFGKNYKCIASPRYSTFMVGEIYKPEDKFLCNLMNLCCDCFEPIEDSEHKPTDKIELKFKIGDWVVTDDGRTGRITGCTQYFADVDLEFSCLSTSVNNVRSWTIQDAKDGDVLATKDIVFIFKHMDKTGLSLCKSYCEVIGNSKLGLGFDFSINDVHPATKEQRNLLFQKMHEAGYVWDVEKKELKKIEQKPAWSEEDERMCQETIDWFEKKCFPYALEHENPARESIRWLRTLKERIGG